MEYSEYFDVKKDVENYFANIIKSRFKKYVEENKGATEKIVNYIYENRLLIN